MWRRFVAAMAAAGRPLTRVAVANVLRGVGLAGRLALWHALDNGKGGAGHAHAQARCVHILLRHRGIVHNKLVGLREAGGGGAGQQQQQGSTFSANTQAGWGCGHVPECGKVWACVGV